MEHFLDTFFKPAILASTWPAIAKGMLVTIEIAILVVINFFSFRGLRPSP